MSPVLLRPGRDDDFEPFLEMNTDPEVMRHFPSVLNRQEAREAFQRMRASLDARGWGVWAVEHEGAFAGMTGLAIPTFEAPFMPCTEILWRLRRPYWGRGLAQAAARQALDHGFTVLGLREIVAFTAVSNLRSVRLMERLGFKHDVAGDFEHPGLPAGHPLRPHVLYRRRPDRPGP